MNRAARFSRWVPAAVTALGLSGAACGGSSASARVETGGAEQGHSGAEGWRGERPPTGEARPFTYPAAQVTQLENGVQLYLVRRPAGTVALSISARAGGSTCRPGESGLAALTLRLMTEATRNKAPLALAEAAESLGSSLGYDTGRDGSSLSMEVLPTDVEAGLGLLAEVVTEPRFSADDVERVKRQWLDSLASERQDPARLSSLAGMRALLGAELGAPVRGSIPDVQRLTLADLQRFHREHFVAGNLAVLAVGDLSLEELRELAARGLGKLEKRPAPALPELARRTPAEQTEVWLVDRPGSVQTALFVGQPFPERSAPGYEAREVTNNLLGGLFTSRLNSNLREKNAYTYGVRSLAIATRRFGAFIGMSSVKTESTADALFELRRELDGLAQGAPAISEEELARSKNDLIHQLGAHLEHVRRVLSDTGELYVDGLAPDYLSRYPSLIEAVDRSAAEAEAKRLTPDRLVVVLVGDRQQIEPQLAAKGWAAKPAPDRLTE